MKLTFLFLIILITYGCASPKAEQHCLGPICESSKDYLLRSQAELLQEQKKGVELENKIKEEQFKALQSQNTETGRQ